MNRLVIMLLSVFVFAGVLHAQEDVRFRVQAGIGESGYIDSAIKNTLGFHVGGYTDIQFTQHPVFLTTGLVLKKRGGDGDGDPGHLRLNAYYLEAPIHVRIDQRFFGLDNVNYFGSLGPYLAFGVSGKAKWDSYSYTVPSTVPGESDIVIREEADSVSSFSKGWLRRFDFGMGVNFGLIFYERYELSATFDMGFLDAMKVGGGKNQHISINLGYVF